MRFKQFFLILGENCLLRLNQNRRLYNSKISKLKSVNLNHKGMP